MLNKKLLASLSIGMAVSVLALYLAFRNVPLKDLLAYMGTIDYIWAAAATLLVVLVFVLRAVRWQIILASSAAIGFRQAFHPLMIGFMINCILPGRVGEIARPVVLQKKEHVPFSTGLATVAVERLFDFGLLMVFFALVLTFIEVAPNLDTTIGGYHLSRNTLVSIGAGMAKLSIVLVVGMVMITFAPVRSRIKALIRRMPDALVWIGPAGRQKMQAKICTPVLQLVDHVADGFELLKHPARIGGCIGLSFLIWGLTAFSHYVMALGCPGINLSFLESSAVMIIICFFIALPSVPGFWGLWEAGGVFALALFGIAAGDAAGYTLANHAVQMFPVILIGLFSAVITGINILKIQKLSS